MCMDGLTASQEERLIRLRRRRHEIQEDAENLRRYETRMIEIQGQVQNQSTNFRENSRRSQSAWRGSTGSTYNSYRDEVRSISTDYHAELGTVIDQVSAERSSLSRELTNVTNAIRNLERIANSGGA